MKRSLHLRPAKSKFKLQIYLLAAFTLQHREEPNILTFRAKQKIVCQSTTSFSAHFHFALDSYIAGLPELEDMLYLK